MDRVTADGNIDSGVTEGAVTVTVASEVFGGVFESLTRTVVVPGVGFTLSHQIPKQNNWSFHGTECPALDQMRLSISNGFYTGNDNETFWIYLDSHPSTRNSKPIDFIMLSQIYSDVNPKYPLVTVRRIQPYRNAEHAGRKQD